MTLKRNSIWLSFVCLLTGLLALGCNQPKTTNQTPPVTETTKVATTSDDCCGSESGCQECAEAAALASKQSDDCGDCPACAGDETANCKCDETTTVAAKLADNETPAKGCCGKCAEEQKQLVNAKTDDCSDCPACAGDATAKCKCEETTTVAAKLAEGKTPVKGCCGKCAEEQKQLVNAKTKGCGDCNACESGDSANCKCMGDTESTKTTETGANKSAEAKPPSDFARDRDVFHFLLANKDKIKRDVKETKNGVETLTESSDPAIVEKIQEHVVSMYRRVENVQPIRMRDPLYREIFKHTDQIEMKIENTDNGIRVTETSKDEYVVKLIQAHAKVVSGFVEHGFEEAHKNHEPPKQ